MARFTTLDAYASAHAIDRLDYLKIDVEGHEAAVIRGGHRTIARTRPVCQIELNTVTAAVAATPATAALAAIADLDYVPFVSEGSRLLEIVPPVAASPVLSRPVMDVYAVPSERTSLITRLRSGNW
jgi:hypothetical protein